MGLSIHYNGEITNVGLISELTEEVKEVCVTLGWSSRVFDDEHFQGICFSPPGCEPLFLTFHNSTLLASPVLWQFKIEHIHTISVKTQFAGIAMHKAVIGFLRHLQTRYFSRFELTDEGGFWESNDESILQKQFSHYNFLHHAMSNAVSKLETIEGETAKDLADRLAKALGRNWSNLRDGEEEPS